MYCHSPAMRAVSITAKLIVSLFAIHYLLVFLGYNLMGTMAMPGTTADKVIHWVVGLSGLYLLIMVLYHLFGGDHCHEGVEHDRHHHKM